MQDDRRGPMSAPPGLLEQPASILPGSTTYNSSRPLEMYRDVCGTGLLLNSAMYLCGCFVAGMVTGVNLAWMMALASMGLAYVSYAIQTAQVLNGSARAPWTTMVTVGVTGLSIAAGIISGCALLLR